MPQLLFPYGSVDLILPPGQVDYLGSCYNTIPNLGPLALNARLVIEGDSITAGSNGPAWIQFATALMGAKMLKVPTYNQATGGQTAAQMATQTASVNALLPTVVSFLGGTNDLSATSDTPATIFSSIAACVNAYTNAGARVVVCKVLPRNDATWLALSASRQADRLILNSMLSSLAAYNVQILDLESTFDPTTMTVEGLHPNYIGARLLGEGFGSLINNWLTSSLITPLYTSSTNLLESTAQNPELAGTAGVNGTGSSGQVANLWTSETNDGGIVIAATKTTLNGATAQRLVVSGTNTTNGRVVNFRKTAAYSGQAGDWVEAWASFSLAAGAANLRGVYVSCDGGQSENSTQTVLLDGAIGAGWSGVLRNGITPLVGTDISDNVQLVMVFAAGVVAADITWATPFTRIVPQ